MSDVASGRRMGKTWATTWATMTAFSSHRHELSEAWQRVREAIIWGFSASAMTHAERRHVRRCERAKVYRPFWPRR